MDIVGVTASAATLIEATSAIATTITTVVTAVRTADARLTNLSTELSQLTNYLQSVHRTLTQCREADLDLIEDELWRHSEICLAGCRATLDELARVVAGVKTKAQKIFKLGSLGWKSRAALELGLRGPELDCFRERLYKSNSALQTMLHTINVYDYFSLTWIPCLKEMLIAASSLSIRSHASQNMIILELSQLKRSIDTALVASTRLPPLEKGTRSHANAARNLREFASLAQSFHSSASSTAGTVRGDNGSIVVVRNESVTSSNEPWHAGLDVSSSIHGDFPPERRARVEMFVRQGRGRTPQREPSVVSLSRSPSLTPPPRSLPSPPLPAIPIEMAVEEEDATIDSDMAPLQAKDRIDHPRIEEEEEEEEGDEDDDDEDDFERAFTEALRQLALDRIKMENYEKAIQFLLEALKRSEAEANDKPEAINKLQIQLALCYILQGTWLLADPLITSLGATKCGFDTSPLLHAVTLGHLATYSFDSALTSCRLALKIQRRRCKVGQAAWDEHPETMGLLATIYDMMGEGIRAEVVRSQLPRWYVYQHPANEVEFMKSQKRFLESVLGYHVPSFLATRYHELDNGFRNYGLPDPSSDDDRLSPVREGVWDATCDVTQLRTNWSRHERMENDTCKEVVEGPHTPTAEASWVKDDADDECSPVTPTEPHPPPLKRRVTRFFRDRRNRRPRDAASPAHPVSPITPLTPQKSAMWWRALKNKLPKNAPRVPRPLPVTSSEDLGQGSFQGFNNSGARHETPDCLDELAFGRLAERTNLPPSYHELDDSSVERATASPPQSGSDVSDETSQTQVEVSSPKHAGTEPSTSPTVYRLPKRRGLDSIRIDTETARTMASQAKLASGPGPLLSDQLGEAIRELANLYCELPTLMGTDDKIVDVESALCKVRELQDLKARVTALSTDSTMVLDIDAAIRRLETLVEPFNLSSNNGSREALTVTSDGSDPAPLNHDKHPDKIGDQGDSDSGYESAETRREPGSHRPPSIYVDENSVSYEGELEQEQKSPHTPLSIVSKQPSFRVGDDSSWMERARELASQDMASEKKEDEGKAEEKDNEDSTTQQPPSREIRGVKTYEGVWMGTSNVMKRMNGLYAGINN